MKTKASLKSKLTATAAVLLFASSAQLSASDYRLWREQVPLESSESRTVGVIGGEQGSWFLNAIVKNHVDQGGVQKTSEVSDIRTSSSSISNNWFIRAIVAENYNRYPQTDGADTIQEQIALNK